MTMIARGLGVVSSGSTKRRTARSTRTARTTRSTRTAEGKTVKQEVVGQPPLVVDDADDVEEVVEQDDLVDADDYLVHIADVIEAKNDPTEYPSWEPMSRDFVESIAAGKLQAVIARHQASRGHACFTGSDNFIYWEKGNNELSVSPDIYVLPGLAPDANPLTYPGSKEEGCWKAWIHGVVPNFAVEIKARRNPRKDELQSPQRHDALGTKELIVFDPFSKGRRKNRKRFVVYRRDAANKLVPVLATNERKVYSEELDAFIIAEGDGNESLLRLAVGPNGETLLPFDSELIEQQTRRAEEESRLRLEAARRADEETRRADEAIRRNAELEAELERLRAGTRKRAGR